MRPLSTLPQYCTTAAVRDRRVTGAWGGKLPYDQSSQSNLSDLSNEPKHSLNATRKTEVNFRKRERGNEMASCSTSQEGARSKVCAVCKCDSESYHLNYGASSCFSCRAFFRRAVQKGKFVGGEGITSYTCKDGGGCPVNLITRRRCQRCRFLACVAAGMRPEAVMDEEGKRTRFRKAIKKRAAKETNGDQLDPASSSGELRLSFGSRKQKAMHSGDAEAHPCDFSSGSSSSTKSEPIQADGHDHFHHAGQFQGRHEYRRERAADLDDWMTARLCHLRRTWDAALRETPVDEHARAAIAAFHHDSSRSRPAAAAANREVFARHLGSLFEVYKSHARMQPEFQAMTEAEQKDVLRRNGPLFLQYVLSGYFGAHSAEEQLDWIFLKRPSPFEVRPEGPVPEDVLTRALGVDPDNFTALSLPPASDQDLDNIYLFSGLSLFLGSSGQHDSVLAMADWAQERWGIGGGSKSFIALSNLLNNAATHWPME